MIPNKNKFEFDLFPRLDIIGKSEGAQLFERAYAADLEGDTATNNECILEAAHNYWDAFNLGIPEAGVNLLRIFATIHLNLSTTSQQSSRYPFQARIDHIISGLQQVEHPAGDYYEALCNIYGLLENGKSDDENFDAGLIKMYDLANVGNKFAADWVDMIESADPD